MAVSISSDIVMGVMRAAPAERMSAAVEDLHAHGHWQTIVRWADALPQETLGRHPVLVQRVGTAHFSARLNMQPVALQSTSLVSRDCQP